MIDSAHTTPAVPNEVAVRMGPTIRRIARRLSKRLPPHISLNDLVGAGYVGLVAAYTRCDPARGEGFEAYAELRIRGAMLDELRVYDPLSRDQRAHVKRIAAARRALGARLGRSPDDAEIAAELGMPLEAYFRHASAATMSAPVSLDGDSDGEAAIQVRDVDAIATDERLSTEEAKSAVHEAMATLPPRLRRIVEMHYAEGLTLREIGRLLGVTESRVWQLRADAIEKLRARCENLSGAPSAPRTAADGVTDDHPPAKRGVIDRRRPTQESVCSFEQHA